MFLINTVKKMINHIQSRKLVEEVNPAFVVIEFLPNMGGI